MTDHHSRVGLTPIRSGAATKRDASCTLRSDYEQHSVGYVVRKWRRRTKRHEEWKRLIRSHLLCILADASQWSTTILRQPSNTRYDVAVDAVWLTAARTASATGRGRAK